jgi:hypothetical protein
VHCPDWLCDLRYVVNVGGPICHEVYEGLRFDCVSPDKLYCKIVDFGGPFFDSSYGFWVFEDVVEREAQGYDNLMHLKIVLWFSGGHDDCVRYLLHFYVKLFAPLRVSDT